MTTCTLPPLTPADCDLRDFPFMLLDVKRLRDSDMALTESPEACWAALLLWCSAWHQVPAGSLPDDDRVLANLAGYGRVVKEWRKHKAGAMHGWVKCSDGRLYHKTVAEKANTAWESKLQQRWKTECARIKKHNERNKTAYPLPQYEEWLAAGRPMGHPIASDSPEPKTDVPSDKKDCPGAVPSDTASKGEGEREGEGYLNTNTHTPPASERDQPARESLPAGAPEGAVCVVTGEGEAGVIPRETHDPEPERPRSSMASAVCLALKADGMASTNPAHPELKALLDQGASVDTFVEAAREMRNKGVQSGNPFAYVIGTVRNQMQQASALATAAVAGAGRRGMDAVLSNANAPVETYAQRAARQRMEEISPMVARNAPDQRSRFEAAQAFMRGEDLVIDVPPTSTPKNLLGA